MRIFEAVDCNKGRYRDIPVPELKDDEILAKVSYCGICGTDYALFSGESGFFKTGQAGYPIRIGHEWSGVVEKVGKSVAEFVPGDRVIGDNGVSCGKCEQCLKGNYGGCKNGYAVGTIKPVWDGAFAEYVVFPQRHLYKVPDNVPLKRAALCEPLSVSYGGTRKMDMTAESTVVVIGTGCIGMSAVALSKVKGAGKVIMVGRNEFKLKIAEEIGATDIINIRECDPVQKLKEITNGKMADFILECSGAESSVQLSLDLAAKRAKIALVAFYEGTSPKMDVSTVISHSLHVFGVMGEYGNLKAVLKIMSENDLKMDAIITGEADYDQLLDKMTERDSSHEIKTMIKIAGE